MIDIRQRIVHSLILVAVSSACWFGCDRARDTGSEKSDSQPKTSANVGERAPDERAPDERAPDERAPATPHDTPPSGAESSDLIAEVLSQPGLPGAPRFEQIRETLLARAKGEPVFFVRIPEHSAASDEILHYRFQLRSSRSAYSTLAKLLPYFEHFPEKGRLTLLREGYLYSEDPDLAYSLVSLVSAHHLFEAEHIWVQRGERLMHARREGTRYLFEDGPHAGAEVRLLHLDRLGVGKEPEQPALHRDFRALRSKLAFDRARVRHITEQHLVADLRYREDHWVTTLLRARGPHLEFQASATRTENGEAQERAQEAARERSLGVRALQASIVVQVKERLPFDEPITEVGQMDGVLRRSWVFAYERGRTSFRVFNDHYPLFDAAGRPLVPQVCMDFLLDTLERTSGTWWRGAGEPRGRTQGSLDFQELLSRNELRRAARFLEFAEDQDNWFELLHIPRTERVKMGHKSRFFRYLAEHASDYEPGDMVFIRGPTPWDPEREHTHSFFVYETDPLSGVPVAIAGNASYPAIWSWETEARRTPLRTVRARVRPTNELLRLIRSNSLPTDATPPLLDVR